MHCWCAAIPEFIHGILPEHEQDTPEPDASPRSGLLSYRRLGERPPLREAASPGSSGRREAAGGSGKKPTEGKGSNSDATAGGEKDEEEDPYEEYPDHCGDLATFIEGRQVVEWVSLHSG